MATEKNNAGVPDAPPPSVTPQEPVLGTEPGEATIKMMVRDIESGRWIEEDVPIGQAAKVSVEEENLYGELTDPGILGPKWDEGRGKKMQARWVHQKPEYHGRFRMRGYEPVDPKVFSDPRYPIRDIPGLGRCNTLGDAVLFEIPREIYEKARHAEVAARRKERLERLFGLRAQDKELMAEHRGLVTISRTSDYDLSTHNPVQDEIDALNRATQFMNEQAEQAHRSLNYP